MVRPGESFSTGVANIRPLSTVDYLVLLQLGLRDKSFITKLTGKLLLFMEISDVLIEDIFIVGSEVTLGTGEGECVLLNVVFGLAMSPQIFRVSAGDLT